MLQDIRSMFNPAPDFVYNTGVIYKEEDISFFSHAIDICSESEMLYRSTVRKLCQESVVYEFFENSTFLAIIRAIIEYFIESVKELVRRFLHVFATFTESKVQIEKYSQQILAYDKPLDMGDFLHYKYTNLEADIPPSIINMQILEEHNDLLDRLHKIGREADPKELVRKLNDFANNIKSDFKDKDIFLLRGEVVGQKKGISKDLYSEELFKIFRDGKSAPITGSVHYTEIHESYRRWKNNKVLSNMVKRDEASIRTNADRVKKQIKDIRLEDITEGRFKSNNDLDNALMNIIRIECDKIQEMCNIALLAFGARLDAIKEAAIQDKKVLYRCISAILGEV